VSDDFHYFIRGDSSELDVLKNLAPLSADQVPFRLTKPVVKPYCPESRPLPKNSISEKLRENDPFISGSVSAGV
jgi:hypothetical protein